MLWTHEAQRNLCLDNWKHRLGFESARAAVCKWLLQVRVRLFQKLLQTRLICRNNSKNAWEKSDDTYSLSIRVHTTKNHISIYVLPQYQQQRKCFFFQSASWKRHCVTHWREQRGRDSYLPRQISQSDCEISSNCGKKMQFKEFDWLSGHGIWAIIPCPTNMVSVRVITRDFGAFLFLF